MAWCEALPPGEVHLHLVDDTAIVAPELLARYAAWLNPEEAARHQQFRFARHRHQFLVARALVRETLSLYCPWIAPAEWCFAFNAYGRPGLRASLACNMDFNLSHTDGRMVLAICRAPSPGVDIEGLDRPEIAPDDITPFFSAGEEASLRGLAEPLRRRRFYELWTLKEAYLKARGRGLSIPLRDFTIGFTAPGALSITFADGVDDRAGRWRLWSVWAGAGYALSLALADAPAQRLRLFQRVPLAGGRELACRILGQT
ncbi:4'-phosphopantetheinyl transferase family protein [Xanthobacter sp. ZOL 2024]